MLICQLILFKGEGNATLTCKTQPHIDAHVVYHLRGLPMGGTLLIGDGLSRQALAIGQPKGEAVIPPLETASLWAAYLSSDGHCLAWGTADGKWHRYVAAQLYDWEEERRAQKPIVEPLLDLTDFGVVAVETDDIRAADSEQKVVSGEETETPEEAQKEAIEADTISSVNAEEIACIEGKSPSKEGEPIAAQHADAQSFFAEDVERLVAAFDEYPPYEPLARLMAGSRWVEVNGGKEDAYLLGLLYDSTPAPTHLVYGVRGQRNRPFAEDAEWLAASDDTSGEGYWLIYHNL